MILDDALDKIQVYLNNMLNAKLDDKEIELLNKYTEAKSKFEKTSQSILELQKKKKNNYFKNKIYV